MWIWRIPHSYKTGICSRATIKIEKGALRAPFFFILAAAAIVVAATAAAVAVVAKQAGTTTAVAQQDDDQDNPANITATETIIVTHNQYLRNFLR